LNDDRKIINDEEENVEAVVVELYNTGIKYSCSYIPTSLNYLTTHSYTSIHTHAHPCHQSGIYSCFIMVPNESLFRRVVYSD